MATEKLQKGMAGQMMMRLCSDPHIGKQFLVLAHLYARTDAATLATLRSTLQKWSFTAPQAAASVVGLVGGLAAATVAASNRQGLNDVSMTVQSALERSAPFVADRPVVCAVVLSSVVGAGYLAYSKYTRKRSLERAAALQANIRVVKRRPVAEVASLLDNVFSAKDNVDTIRCDASWCLAVEC